MTDVRLDPDLDVWLPVPLRWGAGSWADPAAWAREMAQQETQDESVAEHLELLLQAFAERSPFLQDAAAVLLWLPEPLAGLLPVYLHLCRAEGDLETTAREVLLLDDPDNLEPPVVEAIAVDGLGDGLRALRCVSMTDMQGAPLMMELRHWWRVGDVDVVLWLSSTDRRAFLAALEDVDALAATLRIARPAATT